MWTKKCPFCVADIPVEAQKCMHCTSSVPTGRCVACGKENTRYAQLCEECAAKEAVGGLKGIAPEMETKALCLILAQRKASDDLFRAFFDSSDTAKDVLTHLENKGFIRRLSETTDWGVDFGKIVAVLEEKKGADGMVRDALALYRQRKDTQSGSTPSRFVAPQNATESQKMNAVASNLLYILWTCFCAAFFLYFTFSGASLLKMWGTPVVWFIGILLLGRVCTPLKAYAPGDVVTAYVAYKVLTSDSNKKK